MQPELNVTCRSCGNRTALRRRVDTDAGRVIIDDCVICDRARCPGCNELVPGTANYCAGCGTHLVGPDEETTRFLEIAGMRRCSSCNTYVATDRDHSCLQEQAQRIRDRLAGVVIDETYLWLSEDAWWRCMGMGMDGLDEDDQAA